MKKIEKLIFRFDDHSFFLSQYLFKKINLLHDVKLNDEDLMMRYFWKELKVNLVLITSLRESDDTFKNFDRRVRNNETVVKKVHELKRRQNKLYVLKFISFAERMNRLLNNINEKKVITLMIILTKRSLNIIIENKIFKNKNKSFKLCRYYDNSEH